MNPETNTPMATADRLIPNLREQIADRLRTDVIVGRFAEGERLSEASLMERFGVSRTPIREALLQLAQEGHLEAKPNCGVRVAERDLDSIRDLIYPIRGTVETYALRSYFDQLGEEDYREWEEILGRLRAACRMRDSAAMAEAGFAFHHSIVSRAEQKDVEAIWLAIVGRVRFLHEHSQYKKPMDNHAAHAALLKTFRSGDKTAAVEALWTHITVDVGTTFMTHVSASS